VRVFVIALVVATGLVPAIARQRHVAAPPVPTFFERFTAAFDGLITGIAPREAFATFYGGADGLCGSKTAMGGKYDCTAMTAAHRTLPLGSHVYVCGPTGCQRLLINDRGPFSNGADLDLSVAAAKAICGALTSCHVRMWPM
jgi:hypothetical protein